jgi:hypothetical protein
LSIAVCTPLLAETENFHDFSILFKKSAVVAETGIAHEANLVADDCCARNVCRLALGDVCAKSVGSLGADSSLVGVPLVMEKTTVKYEEGQSRQLVTNEVSGYEIRFSRLGGSDECARGYST